MTPFPYSIEGSEPIARAKAMMEEHGIRHLPVTEDRELVGVLSDRDIRVARRVGGQANDAVELDVASVCSRPPYVVELSAALDDVVLEMAERGIGSAVVVRQGKLAGILTTTDVCRVLAEVLREIAPPPGDDDVA
jgi:acetoin utilization protein AcuB